MIRIGSAVAVALGIFWSSSMGAQARYNYDILLDISNEGETLRLAVNYVNRSNSAFCVRYTDWDDYGFLAALQVFNEKGERLQYGGVVLGRSFKTDRYPAFFIVPPGKNIQQYVNLSQFYRISNKSARLLNVKIEMPFVRCGVFERGYIEMPTTMEFDDSVVLSEAKVREHTEELKNRFSEWYRNGYLAFGEATWTAQ